MNGRALCAYACAGLVGTAAIALAGTGESWRTIIEAQAGRESTTAVFDATASSPAATATLVNLNPRVNAWFALTFAAAGSSATYHLENPAPTRRRLSLDAAARGLRIDEAGRATTCTLWPIDPRSPLGEARHTGLPFTPLCDGRLYLRQTVRGNRSALEATAEFLRDHVWRGEDIVGFVRREVFEPSYVERGTPRPQAATPLPGADAPPPVSGGGSAAASSIVPPNLGLAIDSAPGGALQPGRWYGAAAAPGVYVSVAALPAAGSAGSALAYLVAFDLARFDLGFALGTDHPRLNWSPRTIESQRDPGLPGPDGFDSAAPLARTGLVAPWLQTRTVATFTGGFKREHSAFRYGPLAQRHHGSHYGFVEQGVVFSRLLPGLATLVVSADGRVDLRTWHEGDSVQGIRDARQNGVALVERDANGGASRLGSLVEQWGPGNWSGSATEQLRSLRAGACLIERDAKRYLVYGWFSSATPRMLADSFLAYGCRYAMLLDMNALEHTYLALYARRGTAVEVQHLVRGMGALDGRNGDAVLPRFLGQPDNRDFFYLLRREDAK